ncbi:hypothetical protein EJC49_15470 [Aquibium carbonis]|uniref:ABC-three component systems C-terminal domain-containing protein n=1 Tax=Aquibium carbonis TaxID=2495581 RepID=A0A429YVX8_9HYPH|nr:ABC-three component system protein [Aquibium carbonis]RST85486.1 hypothetical protein EJC49_15470 [Aquibium carbonis]
MPLDEAFLRRLAAASDKTLEIFVHHLVSLETATYRDHECYGGSGDKGRDVAGFLTDRRHEGEWHNFQCKQYRRPLGADYILLELGKMFHHASEGAYILPSKYVFVVPGNLSAPARALMDRKSALKAELLQNWETHCARRIVKGGSIPLTAAIQELIEQFDFNCVEAWESSRIMTLPNVVFAAAKAFGDDPGDAPYGVVPADVDLRSEHYGEQLRMVYSEHDGRDYPDAASVLAHEEHGEDFQIHRRRYFDAVEFERYFTDKVGRQHIDAFREDLRSAVHESYRSSTGLGRVRAVMDAAGRANLGGLFGRHGRVTHMVRQGTCHVFANEQKLPWWKKK